MDNTENVISICSGTGAFDIGLRLAIPNARTVCYVEREAFAINHLVKEIEAGRLAAAPIWSDVRTFDGNPWNRKVDWIIGGIPCQPFSPAGRNLGEQDERNLWPSAKRIIQEVEPQFVFIENVPNIRKYYWGTIRRNFRTMGFQTQEGLFSAAEAGSHHLRRRIFLLAYTDHERLERLYWKTRGVYLQSARDFRVQRKTEPKMVRVANGRSNRVDQVRLLGNGVVPVVAGYAVYTLMHDIVKGE